MLDHVETWIPPRVAHLDLVMSGADVVRSEEALQSIARADASAGEGSAALAPFMVRAESVASSKIEHLAATPDDLARALAGSRANASARSMVAAARALQELLMRVGRERRITLADLLDAHRLLMQDDEDPGDREWAGRIREDQNWIGGSDHSPRSALFVPPPPALVEELLVDLAVWMNRDDVPVMLQIALAHGQFESIHPFTDGNGRIGRALIGAVLQRRGVTRHAAVPVASGLHALREDYFRALGEYRRGDLGPLLAVISRAALAAAEESLVSFPRLRGMPETWSQELADSGSEAPARLLREILEHPTLTAEHVHALSGTSRATTYRTLELLERTGILREVTGRKRGRIWVASDVVDELEDLDARVRARLA